MCDRKEKNGVDKKANRIMHANALTLGVVGNFF